jgi:hypothetical protein
MMNSMNMKYMNTFDTKQEIINQSKHHRERYTQGYINDYDVA